MFILLGDNQKLMGELWVLVNQVSEAILYLHYPINPLYPPLEATISGPPLETRKQKLEKIHDWPQSMKLAKDQAEIWSQVSVPLTIFWWKRHVRVWGGRPHWDLTVPLQGPSWAAWLLSLPLEMLIRTWCHCFCPGHLQCHNCGGKRWGCCIFWFIFLRSSCLVLVTPCLPICQWWAWAGWGFVTSESKFAHFHLLTHPSAPLPTHAVHLRALFFLCVMHGDKRPATLWGN